MTVAFTLSASGLAACGASSSSLTSTPAGTSTATDQSALRAVTSSGANDTMHLDSAAYRRLVAMAASSHGLSPPIAAKVADCIVRRETAQGYRTVADLDRAATPRQRAVQDATECTAQALPAG